MTFKNALFTLLTAALIGRSYSEVLGCGGFVKLSQQYRNGLPAAAMSTSPIDFTQISVRLLAKGTDEVKMSTECSPTGYFFVPSYDAGEYDLSVVDNANGDALTFAPARIPVTLTSDASAAANLNKFEFEVTGATLTGTVTGITDPASAVTVTLVSAATKAVVATATATAGAGYRFANVLPGRYEVSAAHPGWRFAQNYVIIDVAGAPVTAAPALAVTGFDVSGRVVLGAKGLGGVYVALYGSAAAAGGSAAAVAGSGDLSAAPAVAQSFGGQPLVAIAASAAGSGAFTFEGVPAGEYAAVPVFAGASAGYAAAAASVAVRAGEGEGAAGSALAEPIRVVSFAVRGRVVDSAGAGVEGAAVRLGKLGAATTDAAGEYAIAGLPATAAGTSAKLAVTKAHYVFEAERAVTVAASLPDTRAAKYDVCGRVAVVVPPAGQRAYPRAVAVKSGNSEIATAKTDAAGAFCVALPSGAYTLAVAAAAAAGLEMEPASLAVEVAAKPVLEGVEFRQKTLAVAGEVRALAPVAAPKAVVVALAGPAVAQRATVELAAGATSAAFAFEGLVAGTYAVSVEGAAADPEWCWAAPQQTITVAAGDANKPAPVVFAQRGYRLAVSASHPVTVAATLGGAEKAVFAASPAAPAAVCLEAPGKYALEVRGADYEFEAPAYAFDTAAPRPVALRAARFRVAGTVAAQSPEAARAITVGTAEGVPVAAAVEGSTVAYAAYVAAGAAVRFIPTSAAADDGTLFYPAERAARVPAAGAPVAVEPIAARPGLYLRGRVTPATEGVRVSVVVRGAPEGTPAVQTVLTDAAGAYVAGPLRDDAEYRELFSHKGLVFNCTNCAEPGVEHVVAAMRLSSITVTVREAEGEAPVPGVLVSVSGGFGDSIYATNAATEADGSFTSGEIFPGSYFVRPMLKEYTFDPATRSVEVAEGDAPEVVFAAKRVAFSAYGRVLALDGTPRAGVLVVATPAAAGKAGAAASSEQAATDDDGRYRIRGLVPGAAYTIAVSAQAATPRQHAVTIASNDVINLDFVAYEAEAGAAAEAAETGGRIEARIDAERSVLPTLEAVLKKAGSAATAAPVKRVKVGAIPMVEMGFVEPGKYEFTLESALSKKHYACKASPEMAEIDLKAGETANIRMAMVCGEEKRDAENVAAAETAAAAADVPQRKASIFSLIALVAVMVASVKHKKIVEMVVGKKHVVKEITAAEIVEKTGVSANVAAKRAKYLNIMGGHDKSDFLPVNPNTHGRKKGKK